MTRRLAHARGGPLEAHEASYERVVATVRRVGIGAGEQLVEAALRIRFRSRNAEAKLPEPWRADRDKQRCDALSMLPQVVESLLDQVATRKIGRSGESHGRDINRHGLAALRSSSIRVLRSPKDRKFNADSQQVL